MQNTCLITLRPLRSEINFTEEDESCRLFLDLRNADPKVIESRKIRQTVHAARMELMRFHTQFEYGNLKRKKPLGRPRQM
jgi:hypothetical protein